MNVNQVHSFPRKPSSVTRTHTGGDLLDYVAEVPLSPDRILKGAWNVFVK